VKDIANMQRSAEGSGIHSTF